MCDRQRGACNSKYKLDLAHPLHAHCKHCGQPKSAHTAEALRSPRSRRRAGRGNKAGQRRKQKAALREASPAAVARTENDGGPEQDGGRAGTMVIHGDRSNDAAGGPPPPPPPLGHVGVHSGRSWRLRHQRRPPTPKDDAGGTTVPAAGATVVGTAAATGTMDGTMGMGGTMVVHADNDGGGGDADDDDDFDKYSTVITGTMIQRCV